MRKYCHGGYSVWRQIQQAKTEGVHDITEEIRIRRAEPAPEIAGKEGVLAHFALVDGWTDAGGWVRSGLHGPHAPEFGLQISPRERRSEERVLLPLHLRLGLRL
jgi:hypothetical protein